MQFIALVAGAVFATIAPAAGASPSPITLRIDATHPGLVVPADFLGLSISSASIDGDHGYTRCFTTANRQTVHLLREIGVKHLRTIMGRAEPKAPDPTGPQIDAFFDFAAASGVNKIIWSMHLYNSGKTAAWSDNRAVATHIWHSTTAAGTVERGLLESFAFDNEPDWLKAIHGADKQIKGYDTPAQTGGYIGAWKRWHKAIAALAPGAAFSGPDTGSKWPCEGEIDTSVEGVPFTLRFARDTPGEISMATQHFYGQTGISNFTRLQLAQACLGPEWIETKYEVVKKNITDHLKTPWRFTECSPFDNEKNPGNQCFATALWAVDFYHWWALRGCAGVNPFTRTAQFNSPIYHDGANYIAEPIAYGMKTFALGSRGRLIGTNDLRMENVDGINLTAYGVVDAHDLYVTIVNKTFDDDSRTAKVTLPAPAGFPVTSARCITLAANTAPGPRGSATVNGARLGGAEIPHDGSSWSGQWTELPVTRGCTTLTVLPATAVVVDLHHDR